MMKCLTKKMVVVCGLIFLVSGCALNPPVSDEDKVGALAQKRLDALLAKDFETAYSFATPAYRKSISLNRHKPKVLGAAMWTKGSVQSVVCAESHCDVTSKIYYRSMQANKTELPTELVNRWIKVDGKWWIYHK